MEFIVTVISLIAAGVIVYGSLQALINLFFLEIDLKLGRVKKKLLAYDKVKNEFGHKLSLALEFLLAADLLSLIFVRSQDQLVTLTVLVVIRIAVNYFLNRDIEENGS